MRYRSNIITQDANGRYRRIAVIDGRYLLDVFAEEFSTMRTAGLLTPRNVVDVYRRIAEHRIFTCLSGSRQPTLGVPSIGLGRVLTGWGTHVAAPQPLDAMTSCQWLFSDRAQWHLDVGMTALHVDAGNPSVILLTHRRADDDYHRRAVSPPVLANLYENGNGYGSLDLGPTWQTMNRPDPMQTALANYARRRRRLGAR